MNRITKCLSKAEKSGKKPLAAYLTGGIPDIKGCLEYIKALDEAGADIIEIGIPFSDALADGPVNQEAATTAIKNGVGIRDLFKMAEEIRDFTEIPVLFLVYYNTVFHYGTEDFINECRLRGIDGLVVPDLPMEERDELLVYADEKDVCLIPLVTPTSGARVNEITRGMKGFTYCVSSMGVTGVRKKFHEGTTDYINEVREKSDLPVLVGFGISDSESAEFFYDCADGIIVGSAIVRRIMEGKTPDEIKNFVASLVHVP